MAYGEVRKGVSERLRQRHGCLEGTGRLLRFYNDQRPHQALCYRTSSKVFHEAIYAPAEQPRNRGMQRSGYCNHQQERWDSRLTQPQSCPTNGVYLMEPENTPSCDHLVRLIYCRLTNRLNQLAKGPYEARP